MVTSFSPFTLAAITTNPLPVVLTTFIAWPDGDVNELEWTTSSETNNDYFTIERAATDGNFIPIGRVDGNGTTSQPHVYHFTDTDPYEVSYYRLKQVDFNGQYYYSPVRIVIRGEEVSLDIQSCNLSNNTIDVGIIAPEGKTVQAQVTDMSGRILYSHAEVIHDQPTHFVTSQLPSGVYFVEVSDGTQRLVRKVQLINE